MSPILLALLLAALSLAFAAAWQRHAERRRQREALRERAELAAAARAAAPLQVPVVDLDRCLGCGTCVRECPENGVLALVHGQAAVVNAAGCVGHARCVSECPVGAVSLSRGDLSRREDVPALDGGLQAVGTPGLFLVGEVTARSLIRTATGHGAQVAASIAQRTREGAGSDLLDAVIVGAGPGGLACALGCRERGLEFVLLDQEQVVGGAVAKYPRRKLVLTDEVKLPLHGPLEKREFAKEELVGLWQDLADRHELPFRGGVVFERVERHDDGTFTVHSDGAPLRARSVVLAIGRRGRPRRLGVPGEELPHVAFGLLDAAAHRGRRCVVVGGGDSAVEAALALAEQPDTTVTIVYRQEAFFRLRSKNRQRLDEQRAAGSLEVLLAAEVASITADSVEVAQRDGGGAAVMLQLRCDDVFVLIGGEAPFAQLRASGVSFDPALVAAHAAELEDPAHTPGDDRGALWAIGVSLLMAVTALVFVLWHGDYYLAAPAERAAEPKHALLRADRSLGLWFGLGAFAALLANLAYLLRRQQWWGVRFGRLSSWMHAHVATGFVAVLLVALHAALQPRTTPGGYASWGMVALLVTGAVGRWFYAWLPRLANGKERSLDGLRAELAALRVADGGGAFAVAAQREVLELVDRRQWRSSWLGRVVTLLGLQWDLWRTRRRLRALAGRHGASADDLAVAMQRASDAHGVAVACAHLEDLRLLLGTWRWLHRWLALLVVLLVIVHVVVAIARGVFVGGGGL
ncbi:MAG: NAD(P)-binding domain-containing protein [Planctomycetes bacterium]|nr:NAD(P)-binding domain-containing protein [Planctomycetota bacterium]